MKKIVNNYLKSKIYDKVLTTQAGTLFPPVTYLMEMPKVIPSIFSKLLQCK